MILYCYIGYAHSSLSLFLCTEVVRRGSRRLNHKELVYRYSTPLVPTVKMRFEKARCSRTTPNSCQRPLHTLLSLLMGSRGLAAVEPFGNSV